MYGIGEETQRIIETFRRGRNYIWERGLLHEGCRNPSYRVQTMRGVDGYQVACVTHWEMTPYFMANLRSDF